MPSLDRNNEIKHGCLYVGFAAAIMFAVAVFSPLSNELFCAIVEASLALGSATQLILGDVTAFLLAWIVFSLLKQRSNFSKAVLAILGLLVAVISVPVAALFAAFPACALLLCRLNCPEQLYFPRPYALAARKRDRAPIDIEKLASLVAACCICIVLCGEFYHQLSLQNANGALLWSLFGSLAIVIGYLRHLAGLRDGIPTVTKVENALFRCAWYIGWLHLILIVVFSYLPTIIVF